MTATQAADPGTALASQRNDIEHELGRTSAEAAARYEMEGAIIMARKFARKEDVAFEKVMKSCKRLRFADETTYSYPRGKETIEGPSVYLAREAARCWGNIRYGCDVIRDDVDSRQIRGWAWDLETNTRVSADDAFAKLVFRKSANGGKGGNIVPDERDLRELTNRRAAILVRNCILSIMPTDLIEDALRVSKETLQMGVKENPDESRKKIIMAFSSINVGVEELEKYLGHALAKASPAQVVNLRTIYKSIVDGNTKWNDYVPEESKEQAPNGPVSGADLTKPAAAKKEKPADKKPEPSQTQEPTDQAQSAAAESTTQAQSSAAETTPEDDDLPDAFVNRLTECQTIDSVKELLEEFTGPGSDLEPTLREAFEEAADNRKATIRAAKKGGAR